MSLEFNMIQVQCLMIPIQKRKLSHDGQNIMYMFFVKNPRFSYSWLLLILFPTFGSGS